MLAILGSKGRTRLHEAWMSGDGVGVAHQAGDPSVAALRFPELWRGGTPLYRPSQDKGLCCFDQRPRNVPTLEARAGHPGLKRAHEAAVSWGARAQTPWDEGIYGKRQYTV